MDQRRSTDLGTAARLSAFFDAIKGRLLDREARAERPPATDVRAAEALDDVARALVREVDDLAATAHRLEQEVAWSGAVLDALPDGLAETDHRGIVRFANARLGAMLGVAPQFLSGKALIHFVARSDCHAFRGWLDAAARSEETEAAVLHLRPRHGGAPFPAELRARRCGAGATRSLVWSVRPWLPPHAAEARREATALATLVHATADAIRAVARRRKVPLVENVATALTIDGPRVAATAAALDEVARAALRLAAEGEPFRIAAHDGGDGETVVTMGPITVRIA